MLTEFDMNLIRISRNILRDILRLAVKDYSSLGFFFLMVANYLVFLSSRVGLCLLPWVWVDLWLYDPVQSPCDSWGWVGNGHIASTWFCWNVCSVLEASCWLLTDCPAEEAMCGHSCQPTGSISCQPCDEPSCTSSPVKPLDDCSPSTHLTAITCYELSENFPAESFRISGPETIGLIAMVTKTRTDLLTYGRSVCEFYRQNILGLH